MKLSKQKYATIDITKKELNLLYEFSVKTLDEPNIGGEECIVGKIQYLIEDMETDLNVPKILTIKKYKSIYDFLVKLESEGYTDIIAYL